MRTTPQLEEYLRSKGHVGSYNDPHHSCFCSAPKPKPAGPAPLVAQALPKKVDTRLIKVNDRKNPMESVSVAPKILTRVSPVVSADVLERVANADIIHGMVLPEDTIRKITTAAETTALPNSMDVVETPQNLADIESQKPKQLGGNILLWIVGGALVYSLFKGNGAKIVKV